VQDDLHFNLLRREPTRLIGMLLVNELDSDDWLWCVHGYSFADGSVCALADGLADKSEGEIRGERRDLALLGCQFKGTAHASGVFFAMRPMVLMRTTRMQ
jgi:hypothetical protein